MDYKKYFKKRQVKLPDKDFVAVKLGGLITAARLHSRMSQAELARKIGTQQPSLARAEKGEVVPSVEFLYKIAKAIKTEFIFPKFGFMENRERTTHILSFFKYLPEKNLLVPTPAFAQAITAGGQEPSLESVRSGATTREIVNK